MKKRISVLAVILVAGFSSALYSDPVCIWESPEGCIYRFHQGGADVNCGDGPIPLDSGQMGSCPGVEVHHY